MLAANTSWSTLLTHLPCECWLHLVRCFHIVVIIPSATTGDGATHSQWNLYSKDSVALTPAQEAVPVAGNLRCFPFGLSFVYLRINLITRTLFTPSFVQSPILLVLSSVLTWIWHRNLILGPCKSLHVLTFWKKQLALPF